MDDSKKCDLCDMEAHIFYRDGKLCKQHDDEVNEWAHAVAKLKTEEAGGPIPQTCPRRLNEIGPWEREENLDTWDIRRNAYGVPEYRSCSFCGSMHPDYFMQQLRDGVEVGPTDKSYKAYIAPDHAKFYFQHLSEEQQREFVDMYNVSQGHSDAAPDGTSAMNVGYPGRFYSRPFFMVT